MAGGEEHAGHRKNPGMAARTQAIQAIADDRAGEFQKAAFHLVLRQPVANATGDGVEFAHRLHVAATVAANHDACLAHAPIPDSFLGAAPAPLTRRPSAWMLAPC